jgi:2-aminoethylphosphonate transport system permease protein
VLVWSKPARRVVLIIFAVVLAVWLVAPLAVVIIAALAETWNGVLPSALTFGHLSAALTAENLVSLTVSIRTALLAGLIAVIAGTWAALSADRLPRFLRSFADALFLLPVAVSSVVIGLGLLVAFSQPPVLLNGTKWIVVAAQTILVFSFAYSTVSAAMTRMDTQVTDLAASLGARPARVQLTVRLPLLLPAITAATALSVALCMGELGATIMVYPPGWRTLPVVIFGLADRGDLFLASADTLVLLISTALLLMIIGRIRVGQGRSR